MKETLAFTRKLDQLTKLYPRLPRMAGVVAVNFSKERFRSQNWLDNSTEPWQSRKRKIKGKRGTLIKSGRLKRSIRLVRVTPNSATIGSDVPYAQIHNEGGRVNVTQSVTTHTRKAHSRRRNGRKETVKEHTVKAHSRKVNFIMPRRQFMGTSAVLNKKIERTLTAEIMRALK